MKKKPESKVSFEKTKSFFSVLFPIHQQCCDDKALWRALLPCLMRKRWAAPGLFFCIIFASSKLQKSVKKTSLT